MDRRNEPIRANQAYWVKNPDTGKGYRVRSKKVLDKLIEEGKVTENHIVQIAVSHNSY